MRWSAAQIKRAQQEADRPYWQRDEADARRQVERVRLKNSALPVEGWEPDATLCDMAERRADLMTERITDAAHIIGLEWLNAQCEPMDARPFAFVGVDRLPAGVFGPPREMKPPQEKQTAGFIARAMCPLWWRRQLRRACVRKHEAGAILGGAVGKGRAWYASDDTVKRRNLQNARNAAILAATELENDRGQWFTLAALVATSPAAKPIRRGELMTRIRGCEEWASAAGMVGVFTTNTAPSRFHSQGGMNPKANGTYGPMLPNSPRDAQQWLCKTWARTRAALQRAGVACFGFRVAEPHKDGCPHWHMLLWCAADQLAALTAIIRAAWLKHEGDEDGAELHRFSAKPMENGGASGYIAKYIAKNIDDAGSVATEGHFDHDQGVRDVLRAHDAKNPQADLFKPTPAQRVESWAAAWGIRQFQAIGQPPVTVWRELRRIDAQVVEGGSDRLQTACRAVHRDGLRRADWAAYMGAQGGAMTGRGYVLRMAVEDRERVGRYETATEPKPVGVFDVERPTEWLLSNRREWRPRGEWRQGERDRKPTLRDEIRGVPAQPASLPWTRFNNCTQRGGMRALTRALQARSGSNLTTAGGPNHHESDYGPPPSTPRPDPHDRFSRIARLAAMRA